MSQTLRFIFKMDDAHGLDSAFFWEEGTYKFILQISGPNTGKPQEMTLFVDWDGHNFVIRSEKDEILERKGDSKKTHAPL